LTEGDTRSNAERPLVTFALFAYNQREFIRDAVQAALAQTYSPLQIILSDDASNDGTGLLIQELASEYRGPHQIHINQNRMNLGLASHINKVLSIAEGELIIVAAGDDISVPERTETLVCQWLSGGRPSAICSSFYSITADGLRQGDPDLWYQSFMPNPGESKSEILERLVCQGVPALIGCTQAWSRDLVARFPPLNADVWFEDGAMSLRAWLCGDILYLPQKLVEYRQHSSNLSNRLVTKARSSRDLSDAEKRQSTALDRKNALLEMHKADLRFARSKGLVLEDLCEVLMGRIVRQQTINGCMMNWWSRTYVGRIAASARLWSAAPELGTLKWITLRLLPFPVYCWLRIINA
jgi:glycosyltransferase involved in cell wall biosynthesis